MASNPRNMFMRDHNMSPLALKFVDPNRFRLIATPTELCFSGRWNSVFVQLAGGHDSLDVISGVAVQALTKKGGAVISRIFYRPMNGLGQVVADDRPPISGSGLERCLLNQCPWRNTEMWDTISRP
ncbi:hypothetical protein AAG570_004560 [Ranatra chinensis]|uniref:Uncharacterized protein n=1 Tax=Ranatra chinensis TaxID=642074 RepID=A0ABD0Y179_9HEMI